jgi:uncharacterized protein (DUF433 family)
LTKDWTAVIGQKEQTELPDFTPLPQPQCKNEPGHHSGQLRDAVNYTGGHNNMPFERISVDPNICHGQACVKGTRIPVHQIVRMLANGDAAEDLLSEYPSLSREDIMACLDYAAALTEEQVTPIQVANA